MPETVRWQEETAAGLIREGTIVSRWGSLLVIHWQAAEHRGRRRTLTAILPRERLEVVTREESE